MGYILFLIFVVLLVAIDLIVGSFFRRAGKPGKRGKPLSAHTTARLAVGDDTTTN